MPTSINVETVESLSERLENANGEGHIYHLFDRIKELNTGKLWDCIDSSNPYDEASWMQIDSEDVTSVNQLGAAVTLTAARIPNTQREVTESSTYVNSDDSVLLMKGTGKRVVYLLPAAAVPGFKVTVTDALGNCGTGGSEYPNDINVASEPHLSVADFIYGGNKNPVTQYAMRVNYQSLTFQSDGTAWRIVAKG